MRFVFALFAYIQDILATFLGVIDFPSNFPVRGINHIPGRKYRVCLPGRIPYYLTWW